MAILKRIIPALLFGVFYASLILAGWGIDDISGFFSNSVRMVLFAVTITVNSLTMLFKDRLGVGLGEKVTKKLIPFAY